MGVELRRFSSRKAIVLASCAIAISAVGFILLNAPDWIVPIVRERVRRLRPGMTDAMVRDELGLVGRLLQRGPGGGSRRRNWVSYQLGPGRGVMLVYDWTDRPPRLVGAHLVGNGWPN